MTTLKKYVVLEKAVGQTPLECMEQWRAIQPPALQKIPLTYAGRLDPMASGKLLVLIGEECKQKEHYLALDKQYTFSILLGISSDSGDILGLPTIDNNVPPNISLSTLTHVTKQFIGAIELPYPHYSSKTVAGKPLHTWTIENRLNEIDIPTRKSTIFKLTPTNIKTIKMEEVLPTVQEKINTIPPVTDTKKALGNDFRRPLIRPAWESLRKTHPEQIFYIADFTCIASSGTYMRTLAQEIATAVGTTGLAWHIHRDTIGRYQPLPIIGGVFWRRFT